MLRVKTQADKGIHVNRLNSRACFKPAAGYVIGQCDKVGGVIIDACRPVTARLYGIYGIIDQYNGVTLLDKRQCLLESIAIVG